MKRGGSLGSNTLTGEAFETLTDAIPLLNRQYGDLYLCAPYHTKDDVELVNVTEIIDVSKAEAFAVHFRKTSLYTLLADLFPEQHETAPFRDRLSAKVLPDDAFYFYETNTLQIIEKKFQQVEGSTDVKLGAADSFLFKYERLLQGTGVNVHYRFLLNDWFKKTRYTDSLDYLDSRDIPYDFNEIDLRSIGFPKLEEPVKIVAENGNPDLTSISTI